MENPMEPSGMKLWYKQQFDAAFKAWEAKRFHESSPACRSLIEDPATPNFHRAWSHLLLATTNSETPEQQLHHATRAERLHRQMAQRHPDNIAHQQHYDIAKEVFNAATLDALERAGNLPEVLDEAAYISGPVPKELLGPSGSTKEAEGKIIPPSSGPSTQTQASSAVPNSASLDIPIRVRAPSQGTSSDSHQKSTYRLRPTDRPFNMFDMKPDQEVSSRPQVIVSEAETSDNIIASRGREPRGDTGSSQARRSPAWLDIFTPGPSSSSRPRTRRSPAMMSQPPTGPSIESQRSIQTGPSVTSQASSRTAPSVTDARSPARAGKEDSRGSDDGDEEEDYEQTKDKKAKSYRGKGTYKKRKKQGKK